MILIKKITAVATFEIRQPVLRNGKPLETCFFLGDDLPSTNHYGIYEKHILVGVISSFQNNNSLFAPENQAQIRAMAVLNNFQKKGYGKLVLEHCENILQKEKRSLIWFNARTNAVGFYEKLGYKTIGNPFNIEDIGIHYVMYKTLKS